ncbi:pentatricopeptide repeat-containing protein At3g29290-like [Silene latifolia]|uniref:pentatricopeptide repeat-containing protein At3g29290-like n=1 Tax=Silene latifolia TaxID=37657 RepID=UPI003D770DD4
MLVMTESLANSPSKLIISNGFGCSNNQDCKFKCFLYVNSRNLKQNLPHEITARAVIRTRSVKFRKFVNFRVMVANIEPHGLVCEQKVDSCVEGFDDDGGERERRRLRLSRNCNLGGDLECGRVVSEKMSLGSRRGENKVFHLEGRDEEVMVSRGGKNKVFSLEGRDEDMMVSRGGENKVFYLEERDEKVLSKRILSLTRSNRKTSALVLFRSMEMSGLRPNLHACNSLLACFARNNMLDGMLRVFEFMKKNKIGSGHSCSLMLKALAEHCGSDAALQAFLEWEGESEMNQHFDSVLYNTMISIFAKENDWAQMKKIWESMKENGIIGTEVTYRVLVCTFVRCCRYENAIDAYSELLQNELEPDIDTMQAIIGACAKEEKWDMALSVFHSMLKCGLKPNLVACNALINLLGKAGKVKEAYKVYKRIRSLGHVPDSYTWKALLSAFYRANQYTAALQLFDGIQKDLNFQPSSYLYNTSLMCCQRLGYWEKALQYLWKMEEAGITVSTESYNIVISVCESAKKPKVALEIYEHMALKKCRPDTFTHLSLIRSCIWGDLWDEVHNILDESTPNVSLYNAAIHGMCLRRKFDSAKELYIKMRDLGLVPDGKTRALMLQYMRRGT